MVLSLKQPSPSDLKEGPKVGLKLPNQHPPFGGCFFWTHTNFLLNEAKKEFVPTFFILEITIWSFHLPL